MQLQSQLASAVCRQIQREGVVCPSQLRHGLFTTLVPWITWITIHPVQLQKVPSMGQELV